MWLVVGLGNPGRRYAGTRHNIGFDVIENLANRWTIPAGGKQLGSLVGSGRIAVDKAVLARPQSFMNRSGHPVRSLLGYYKLDPQRLLVIHDDLDLPFGSVKLKNGGGHGGHNGLRDIIQHIGKDFLRVRMGIGRPPQGWDQANYVLSRWNAEESKMTEEYLDRGTEAIESILTDGIVQSMNVFNVRNTPPNQQPVDGL